MNDDDPEMGALPEVVGRTIVGADLPAGGGEGRCREGRNGRVHLTGRRGIGPSIQGRTRRDNVGKGHLPAGADSNLQRPAKRGNAEVGRRDLVWRMSQYEQRRRGNALRGGVRHHPGGGNTRAGQRGSGHLADAGYPSDTEPRKGYPRSSVELVGKPIPVGAYAGQRFNLARIGKVCEGKPRSEPDSGNPTVRDRRGARGNVAHGGTVLPPRINRKGGDGNPPPKGARAPALSRPAPVARLPCTARVRLFRRRC